jgi:hypothetical protein
MPEEPHARSQLAHFTSSSRSRVPDAEHGRGAGDRVKVRQTAGCRMHGGSSAGPKTAEGLARIRAAQTIHGRDSAENRQVATMIRILRAEAKRLLDLT